MSINLSDGKWVSQPFVGVSKLNATEEISAMYFISNK